MSRQSGFSILSLLLTTVALMVGLSFILSGMGPSVQGHLGAQKAAQLVAQAQLIVHRLGKCATDYPDGDNGTAFHKAYPSDANPGAVAAAALVCPGSQQSLWSGVDGVYAPGPIPGFGPWAYSNGNPMVITITTLQPETDVNAVAAAVQRLGVAAAATTTHVAGDTLSVRVIE